MARMIGAIVAVFVAWMALDMVIHGWYLKSTYEATQEFWRPEAEMKMGLMSLVCLIASACFVLIYGLLISEKNMKNAITYSALFGISAGVSMGYGTYSFMPIPYHLALAWFLGVLIECLAAGVLVGLIVTPAPEAAPEVAPAA